MHPLSVALVGAHGYGARHLANIVRLQADGVIRLVGICSRNPDPATTPGADLQQVPVHPSLADLLSTVTPDITIIATPPHTHVALAIDAMRAGSHVLLEKPPATTLHGFHELQAAAAEAGVLCQVGFQSFGSPALDHLRDLIERGELGSVAGIGGIGAGVRDVSYFGRSPWAGRRRLDGTDVVDGALTNTFAHAIAAALRIDGSDMIGSLRSIEADLYRANAIEADDTSSLRLRTARGTPICIAVTLCAELDMQPYLVVEGTEARATLTYQRGELRIERGDRVEAFQHPLVDLLLDLVRVASGQGEVLIAPLDRTGAFTEVLEAVRTAPEPRVIPPAYVRVTGGGPTERRWLVGIEDVMRAAVSRAATYSEVGAPWAIEPS